MKRVTLAFSTHRPETLAYAREAAQGHGAIALEEPPTPGFAAMLAGDLAIDEYTLQTDYEFPEFARGSCEVWRELHKAGAKVLQVEPFLEALAQVHELFADGGSPADLRPDTLQHAVYHMERVWTGALVSYYSASQSNDFGEVLAAVQAFARADAAKGAMRESLRAQALVPLAREYSSLYVEAGYLHHFLLGRLKKLLPEREVMPVWLLEEPTRALAGKRQVLNPGDKLTLLYACRPQAQGPLPDLLAARSLIHVKVEAKEELEGELAGPLPHLRDELRAITLAERLSLEECRELYPRIRGLSTEAARQAVEAHLAGRS